MRFLSMPLCTAYVNSPFGYWEIQGSELGVSRVRRITDIPPVQEESPELLKEATQQLSDYFKGTTRVFDVKLDFGGAPYFYRSVWEELLKIPYGQTTTYLAIASALGNRLAVRAVGQASARNPIAVIVPCHRCIAGSGDLQGYFYGLDLKRALLELENPRGFGRQGKLF